MTEEQAYRRYCVGCWREAFCHEECTECDKFLEALKEKDYPIYIDKIAMLMVENNETQTDLANATGATRCQVANWLSCRSRLDIESLIKIADHYGKTTDWLLGRYEKKNEPETAATSPAQGKGENEMNDSLPSHYNT